VLLTGADLPNAFPYFVAIERLLSIGVPPGRGLLILAGYAVVYCLPCVVLLIVGLSARTAVRARLEALVARFGTGTVRRSVPTAGGLMLLGFAVGSIPFWLLA
jgi:hypothetical protein